MVADIRTTFFNAVGSPAVSESVLQSIYSGEYRVRVFEHLQVADSKTDYRNDVGRSPVTIHVRFAYANVSANDCADIEFFVFYGDRGMKIRTGISEQKRFVRSNEFEEAESKML